ncbi:MAG TPA: hypothetical protein VFV38_50520 [Ktedonobacteraceae bacterium]|nr:hypothetical protein [Ktedonobacteraceae bacterium]
MSLVQPHQTHTNLRYRGGEPAAGLVGELRPPEQWLADETVKIS